MVIVEPAETNDGSKFPALTPVPEYVPPAGLPPVKAKAALYTHTSLKAPNATTGKASTSIVVVFESAGQEPTAAIELVTVYVPGVLADKSTTPVLELIVNPAVDENTPPFAPEPNTGEGSVAFAQ